jgi:CHASE3 domain sensor protein
LAQFHNLDRLIEQTEKLTATTETIKAEIQHKVWETQTTLTLKRDVYTRLLESIGEMIEDQQESKSLESMRRTKFHDMRELTEKLTRSKDRLDETMRKWSRAIDVAPILISDEAFALLPTVFLGLIPVNFDGLMFPQECDRNIEHLKTCRYRLQQAARADFGMTKLGLDKPL